MPTVKEIYDYINSFAPYSMACDWDNTGISEGDVNKNVEKIVFALDITSEVADFAAKENADLVVTHHPLIFKPVKEIPANSALYKLINCGIAHISAHTNFDMANEGVNTVLCEKLGLKIVNSVTNNDICIYICELQTEIPLYAFAENVKNVLGGSVRLTRENKKIKNVAVCSGAGAEYLPVAKNMGADVLLTGDGGHHDFLDADELGIALVAAGHFETENPAIDLLMKKIEEKFGVECQRAPQSTPIVTL